LWLSATMASNIIVTVLGDFAKSVASNFTIVNEP
jgi:hypothetical protein